MKTRQVHKRLKTFTLGKPLMRKNPAIKTHRSDYVFTLIVTIQCIYRAFVTAPQQQIRAAPKQPSPLKERLQHNSHPYGDNSHPFAEQIKT